MTLRPFRYSVPCSVVKPLARQAGAARRDDRASALEAATGRHRNQEEAHGDQQVPAGERGQAFRSARTRGNETQLETRRASRWTPRVRSWDQGRGLTASVGLALHLACKVLLVSDLGDQVQLRLQPIDVPFLVRQVVLEQLARCVVENRLRNANGFVV